jgi:MFS family permease
MNQIDRLVLPYVQTDMNKTIHFTPAQYALLVGYGFTIFFVVVGIFAGPLADRMNRKVLLMSALVFWSAMMVATGYSTEYWHLLVSRLGLGIGTAACNPAAFSILSDYFPPEKRTVANSVYTMGIYFGGGAGSILAGIIAQPGHKLKWELLFQVFGFLGFGIAVVGFLTVREPRRGTFSAAATTAKPSRKFTPRETIRYLMAAKTPWLYFTAAGVRTMGGGAFGGFVPGFLRSSFTDNVPKLLFSYGAITLVCGAAASFGGGAIARRWQATNKRAGALIGAIGAVTSLPFVLGIMYSTDLIAKESSALVFALCCLGLEYLTAEVWGGPASAVVSNILPAGMQGTGFSIYFAVSSLIGGAGPSILGLFLTHVVKDTGVGSTRTLITALVIVATYFLSAVGFVAGTANLQEDIDLKEHVEATGQIPEVSRKRFLAFLAAGLVLAYITIVLIVLSLIKF